GRIVAAAADARRRAAVALDEHRVHGRVEVRLALDRIAQPDVCRRVAEIDRRTAGQDRKRRDRPSDRRAKRNATALVVTHPCPEVTREPRMPATLAADRAGWVDLAFPDVGSTSSTRTAGNR